MSDRMKRLIVGVGNAGTTVVDLLAVEEPGRRGLVIVNNDSESIAASVVRERITVPQGDPADGFGVIDPEFVKILEGAASVVLCGGLGGETASFLIPALAILAKSSGITVAACVGLPFGFEGRRRSELATEALGKLHAVCDAVAVIPNERLSGPTSSTASVGEAFALADRTLLACTRTLQGMLSTSGPVKIGRADLHGVLGTEGARTLFGSGHSSGPNRLHEALEAALASPLLVQEGRNSPGSALLGAGSVLVLLEGPSDLSFAEVEAAVSGIERIAGDRCQTKTGVLATHPAGTTLTLSIVASIGGGVPAPTAGSVARPPEQPAPRPETQSAVTGVTAGSVKTSPPKRVTSPTSKQTQGTLDLDTYQRGRFDKSEPTIVAGEDLDVPTFLRKGIKLTPPRRR